MRYKSLIISSIAFFVLINTVYFWAAQVGVFAIPIFMLLITAYIFFAGILIRNAYNAIKEKFNDPQRLIAIVLLAVILTSIYLKPTGFIDFEKFEGENLLVAEREGSANCNTTFQLKENNQFIERSVCFGISVVKGTYEIKGDTIFFSQVNLGRVETAYYQYAIIRKAQFDNKKIIADLVRYKNHNDTIGSPLWITKNRLKH